MTDTSLHILGGAGNASREHYLNNSAELSSQASHILDIDAESLENLSVSHNIRATVADVLEPLPLQIANNHSEEHLALIATPMKAGPLKRTLEAGFQSVIIDKPIANSKAEAIEVETLLEAYPNAKVCLLESYCVKSIPLFYLSGALEANDPRVSWIAQEGKERVDTTLHNSLRPTLGSITGMSISVLEGGAWGFPDLESIPYLLSNPETGGMLRCLFPHAMHPLLSSNIIDPNSVLIEDVELFSLHRSKSNPKTFEHKWYPTAGDELEAIALIRLSADLGERRIPISVTVGKHWGDHHEGNWRTHIIGTRGELDFCTMKGKDLVLRDFDNSKETVLRLNDCPYKLSLREAKMYLAGEIPGDGNIENGLIVSKMISDLRELYETKLPNG
ncbi:MAG: Gfo/Idh/MocA family oxidoreductase [Bdellovibrionales bacterium]|nr:Gfo/Idh/MocA family oxidoreductase [Bdellovibrionales bacterium]